MSFRFFLGLHQPCDAWKIPEWAAFISVNRLRRRKGGFKVGDWIMDSGAFTELKKYGRYRHSVEEYACQVKRWSRNGNLLAAVTQDYMCEEFMLQRTGLTVEDHQRLTIERYDGLVRCNTGVYIMPVLQGYDPQDYVRHLRAYGDRLKPGMWVGVGSVCKRNGNIAAIEAVLLAINKERPDLRLHGFGLKTTALSSGLVQELLATADSMAWSFHARMNGRDGNSWKEARAWAERMASRPLQYPITFHEHEREAA